MPPDRSAALCGQTGDAAAGVPSSSRASNTSVPASETFVSFPAGSAALGSALCQPAPWFCCPDTATSPQRTEDRGQKCRTLLCPLSSVLCPLLLVVCRHERGHIRRRARLA